MCGIVGYVGYKPAKNILLEGLKSLEYRGYDSSGLALLNHHHQITIVKTKGKIAQLERKISDNKKIYQESVNTSHCGIGHTRWATHGKVNDLNCHPHQDTNGEVVIVHNGIIKNFFQLKDRLQRDGYQFISDTDTEVIAQLVAFHRSKSQNIMEALRNTLQDLDGSYALALIDRTQNEPKIFLTKKQSPLVIGIGDKENFIASDSSTVLLFTDKFLKLKDDQIAVVSAGSVTLEDLRGKTLNLNLIQATKTTSILEKGPYKHFLLKEIHEQPAVLGNMLNSVIIDENQPINIFNELDFDISTIKKISFVACGSAYHAALIGKYLIEELAKIKVETVIASEFCSKPCLIEKDELVIGISQSGETADTLAAITNAQNHGAKIMAIINKKDSALYDLTYPNNYVTPAGIEVSVASTKAFTSQVLALYFLAIKLAETKQIRGLTEIKNQLHTLPIIVEQCIEREDSYYKKFITYSKYRDFIFLSRGVNYPVALEGALKLKELSYIHAAGYPSGEMKHGPIAILDENVPVLSIAVDSSNAIENQIYKKILSNAQEAKARMSPSLVIACDDNQDVNSLFDDIIRIPNIDQLFSPLVATIPLQFLAYFIAEDLGKDVDQPRNLAKSVTVE